MRAFLSETAPSSLPTPIPQNLRGAGRPWAVSATLSPTQKSRAAAANAQTAPVARTTASRRGERPAHTIAMLVMNPGSKGSP
ncbi:hypothetical protein GCM10027056_25010 [Glaciibacter psychrotolerans]